MENKATDNPQKFFNPEEYITKIIGVAENEAEETSNNKEIDLLTSLITDPKHKDAKEETLLFLKKDKKEEFLLMAIAQQKNKTFMAMLVAACWESEINFSKYLPFFILLVLDKDYLVSLEAITVISEMKGPFEQEHLKQAVTKIKDAKKTITNERVVLLNDLVDTLNGFMK